MGKEEGGKVECRRLKKNVSRMLMNFEQNKNFFLKKKIIAVSKRNALNFNIQIFKKRGFSRILQEHRLSII